MKLIDLLSRADEQTMQELLGKDALRLIQLLNRKDDIATRVKDVLVQLYTLEGLLLVKDKRVILFDLLRPKEVQIIAKALGLSVAGDIYQKLKLVNLRRGSDKEAVLFGYFGLVPPVVDEQVRQPQIEGVGGSYKLFPHQRIAAHKVEDFLSKPPRRVLLHMPTGSGKTRTAMHVIASHLNKRKSGVVVWLAYSEELCEQGTGEFIKAWQSLGNRDLEVHRYWGSHDLDLDKIQDGVLVAGFSKVHSAIRKDIRTIRDLATKCSLVIIDEAHQAIAETYQLILDALYYKNKDTGLLGLTATPGRSTFDMDHDAQLAEFFERQKVTLDVEGYKSPIDFLVDNLYLAKTEYKTINYQGNNDFSGINFEGLAEIPIEVLKSLAKDELRNLKILSAAEGLTKHHKRILIFAITVEHAEMIAAVLRGRGFCASSIVSGTPREERRRLLDDFKNASPDCKILCNFGVLTTGFDAPKTSAALIARPTKSLVLYSQMVGRVTRGVKAGGSAKAEVVTVVDLNVPGFRDMVSAFYNWEDVW